MRGDSNEVPKSVELSHNGLTFKVPIWVEMPRRVVMEESRNAPPKNLWSEERTNGLREKSLLGHTEVSGHVGSSYDPDILNWTVVPAREESRETGAPSHYPIKKNLGPEEKKNLGPDHLAHFVSFGLEKEPPSFSADPIAIEFEAISTRVMVALQCEGGEITEQEQKKAEEEDTIQKSEAEEKIIVENTSVPDQRAMQEVSLAIEDAVPLNHHLPDEGEDPDFDIPIWIHQIFSNLPKNSALTSRGAERKQPLFS